MSRDVAQVLRQAASGDGGGLRRGLWLSFLTPYGLEAALSSQPDWVGVDLQHGDLEPHDLPGLLRVTEKAGLPLLVRMPSDDPRLIGRVLDAGADGVIVPGVESGAAAAALAAACRVPPHGTRSSGLVRTSLGVTGPQPGRPVLLPMVETAAGLAAASDIAAVDGVDGVFVGPYDLSLSAGFPGPTSPETVAALRRVVSLAHGVGKAAGFYAGHPDLLALAPEADIVAVDSDVTALRAGLAHVFRPA